MKLLLIGVTGLVGRHVLDLALADSRVHSIVALTRKPLPAHPKLSPPLIDYDNLPDSPDLWAVDAVICTLGTTIRVAGSKEAFRRVDYDYPLAVAKLAKQHGTPTYVLNSAVGANASSRFFYNQVKGDLENTLASIGFASLTFVRPGLIGGQRQEFRLGEHVMTLVLRVLGPLLPRRMRINPAQNIARALLDAAIAAEPGQHRIGADQLV
jgi:uncharacterized protein YbjT (DUF2867 family)